MPTGPHLSGRPVVLSAFSGAGGLDIGLESAGFDVLGALEVNRQARETLQRNRPQWRLLEPADVMEAATFLAPQSLGLEPGDLDLLAGGPPCQPFSMAAQWADASRAGLSDPRGKGILGFLGLVDSFLPRYVLIENVPGFLRGPVSARREVEEGFEEINDRHGTQYRLVPHFVNAADYGVPQRRQRLIAVSARDGDDDVPPLPAPSHAGQHITAWDALHDLVQDPQDTVYEPRGYTALLPSIPEGRNYLHLTDRGEGEPLFGYRTRYRSFLLKLAKDQPSWTLAASPGPNTGPFHWDDRPLTVRERMRLQTFPDDWRLCGAERDQVRLVGNATPPVLAEALGRMLMARIDPGSPALAHPAELLREHATSPVPPRRPPRPVPKHFRHRIGTHAAHAGTGLGPAPRSAALRTAR